ncbi:MAG TPA: monofunctional biosynthetic peptidoglycan transglycosylase [Blastocatellia bacterium]|nr:monofunctional biosynthetic peptidoglycan transglycosylase [Blastocatellia bacterium]
MSTTVIERAPRKTVAHRTERSRWRRWIIGTLAITVLAALFYHSLIVLRIVRFKHANPATTALIEQRADESRALGQTPKREQTWVPYERISPSLVRAVLAGEDSRFFDHAGFDWEEIQKALEKDWEEKQFQRGASTISQQLAKNLFLSTSKNPLRKVHEALITAEMERILGKRRILELYLNVIEWGDGIYGAEAAARHYFGVGASSLSFEQAAFLSAIIPNPRGAYNPSTHKKRIDRRSALIQRLMRHVVIPRDLD